MTVSSCTDCTFMCAKPGCEKPVQYIGTIYRPDGKLWYYEMRCYDHHQVRLNQEKKNYKKTLRDEERH
jgi:hypothetical protein